MKLHGAINLNLEGAISSAHRLRGHPVYPDTILHWQALVSEARRLRMDQATDDRASLDNLIIRLENELAARSR